LPAEALAKAGFKVQGSRFRLLRKVNLPLNPPEASLGASSKGDFCIVLNFSVSPLGVRGKKH
jgi:hypothetical protein